MDTEIMLSNHSLMMQYCSVSSTPIQKNIKYSSLSSGAWKALKKIVLSCIPPSEIGLLQKYVFYYRENTKITMCAVMIGELYTEKGLHHEIKEGNCF